jgi:hypothetical protein
MEIETEVRKLHDRIDILYGLIIEILVVQTRHDGMFDKMAEPPEIDDSQPVQYDAALEAAAMARVKAGTARISALLAARRNRYL